MTPAPVQIAIIGDELCVAWPDGNENFFAAEFLRAHSPSAANKGETDIFGNRYGGDGPSKFPGVKLKQWYPVGNYAVRLEFSDGHNSGIYSWDYLKTLSEL